ncbi:MAG: sigma-70 family RNA polymerase sigma factor [Bacteroidaceae bacterium]|nr:sigma-70 family RNA polymerase sigma factor [Bacteroidaceae bacterium]
MKKLTDQEIIDRLIARDNQVTEWFFYTKCQPLFSKIIFRIFDGAIEYAELVGMVYDDLMRNDSKKLRQFQFRSTLTQYIKVVANNLAMQKKDEVIENVSKDYLYEQRGGQLGDANSVSDSSLASSSGEVTTHDDYSGEGYDSTARIQAQMDLENLFAMMSNKRYVYVLRKLMIEGMDPSELAKEMEVTVDNLYNIKRRAMKELTHVALKDIDIYVNVYKN